MPNDPIRVKQVVRASIAPMGETVTITARQDDGSELLIEFDAEHLEAEIPNLTGIVMRARQIAEGGVPPSANPGDLSAARAMAVSGAAVHVATREPKLVLELALRSGLSVLYSLPIETADHLCTQLLQELRRK